MSSNETLGQLNEIFRNILDNDAIVLTPQTSAKDIDEWDSLNHIQLVVAIEKKYKVRFNTAEIQKWANVGNMIESIEQRQNG